MKLNKSTTGQMSGKAYKIAVILARFNDELGLELYKNTRDTLMENGVLPKNIDLIRAPGALELPLVAQTLAHTKKYHAIIALGVVIKGDTPHFDYVCQETYRGLMDVNLTTGIPTIFGVLTVNNLKQAKDRTSKTKLNKGKEFAESALEMANLIGEI